MMRSGVDNEGTKTRWTYSTLENPCWHLVVIVASLKNSKILRFSLDVKIHRLLGLPTWCIESRRASSRWYSVSPRPTSLRMAECKDCEGLSEVL